MPRIPFFQQCLLAAVFLAGLVSPVRGENDLTLEVAPIVSGLNADGLQIGFDSAANGSAVRSFKVGTATVQATMRADGSVGFKVTSGTLTLTSPSGEPMASLTEGDDIQIDGFLDTKHMFDAMQAGNSNVLRLGAVGAVSFQNRGKNPVNLTVNKANFVVGAGGRQDAAVGKVINAKTPITQEMYANLKNGETLIGVDATTNKPISISKDWKGKEMRTELTDTQNNAQLIRAGNDLVDGRNVKPTLGVTRTVKIGETTVEITGTANGARVKVVSGPELILGTANHNYVGSLPLGSDIEISGLSVNDSSFLCPVTSNTPNAKPVLLMPPTANYSITNLNDKTNLTLGKPGSQQILKPGEKTNGNLSGYSTPQGLSLTDPKKVKPGTGVEITNDLGEKIFVQIGDPLEPNNPNPTVKIINISNKAMSLESFGLGNIICPPNGGITAPASNFNLVPTASGFKFQIPTENLKNIKNAGPGNSIVMTSKGIFAMQGANSIEQSLNPNKSNKLTSDQALNLLGTGIPDLLQNQIRLGVDGNTYQANSGNSNNENNQNNNDNNQDDDQTLTQQFGGTTTSLQSLIDTQSVQLGIIPVNSP